MPASNHPELRHLRSGSLSIPHPHNARGNGIMNNMPANQRFDAARSPPNTSHVPCKFFRQGACQAGNACPFSHDLGNAAENVCKYFAKGNCKFGPKCANIHVLPDGRRVNYSKNGVTLAPAQISLGSRVNPATYNHPHNSALTNGFIRGEAVYGPPNAYLPPDDYDHQLGGQPSMENGLPTIDTTYSSNPASAYGSPRDEDLRINMGLSPITFKGLSVLDAPLPASFDSNGISHAARYGPWPSSMPSKFGLDSPSASLSAHKDSRTSETLKLLHTSAFGSNDHMSPSNLSSHDLNFAAGSPPVHPNEEYFGKRTMHSARFSKPRMLSASVPKVDRDWEAGFPFEEDYVPSALANDVLTPQEKARRGSSSGITSNGGEPSSLPKFGSLGASGPGIWGPPFQRQRADEESDLGHRVIPGKSMKHAASAFGHVGSPLRNSSLANTADLDGLANGHGSPGYRSRGESMSALTQQLRSTRLGEDTTGVSPRLHPNSARALGGTSSLGNVLHSKDRDSREQRGSRERNISSGSVNSPAMIGTPIDEENEDDPSFVFSMDEVDDSSNLRSRKRVSGGVGSWSYAGVAAGAAKNGVSNGNKPRDGLGVGGR